MKVIDLLNKIASGEKPTIRYQGYIFNLEDSTGYKTYGLDYDTEWLSNIIDLESQEGLNTEVEILEENKKIEHLTYEKDITEISKLDIIWKINEIIDYINREKE